ncbi:hypothetical protein [Paludisphaera mucosa]|uniref:Uncharacterized protein n=1 Tax=Paludisphaera mucosa TaxID=3030827 RepID=A0ABT6FIP2_9BACT|nr:hypothetical protein [Paludisphaera mucosa]MDG3007458.1 hypothetical protein [Paludisphaera mucosa]
MRYRGKVGFVGVLVGSIAIAGCGGGEASGKVEVDNSKDQNLMKAMGGYMDKRPGAKTASKPKAGP